MRIRGLVAAAVGGVFLVWGFPPTVHRADAADTWGACCLAHGACLDGYDSTSCSNVGGAYSGDGSVCSSVTCQAVPCGESGSPVCGGTCPNGQRCIDTEDLLVTIVVAMLTSTEEGGASPNCQCADVRCGGVPLQNGQGCCAGTPFTIGVQGCCNGEVVPVDSPCNCQENDRNGNATENVNLPIDLRDTGCCRLDLPVTSTDDPQNIVVPETFNVAEAGCCQRLLRDEEQGPLIASQSIYTFGTGLDCCPGGPIDVQEISESDLQQVLDAAGLCVGGCFEGECASQDCCRCEEGCEVEVEDTCVSAGSQSSCDAFCSTLGCEDTTYVANAMCSEDGSCIPSAAAAPAASPTGLAALLVALLAIGGFAILARRKRAS